MPAKVLVKDDCYVLNHCTKHLARESVEPRHNFGQFQPDDPRGRICESWRFPIIDAYSEGKGDADEDYLWNEVTFVYLHPAAALPREVALVATFAGLYDPVPMHASADTQMFSVTCAVRKGAAHTYHYLVDGQRTLDPINPQRVVLDNGRQWSRFFTELCTQPLSFEQWELRILDRLTRHILPFRTREGEALLGRFVNHPGGGASEAAGDFRLYEPPGTVNFIDKLLARAENHHLIDYKICLALLDNLLRERHPFADPSQIPTDAYVRLYDEMSANAVPGWDYQRYNSPLYFLQMLRRHTYTGAFSHPRHGGNVGAVGWAFLEERYRDAQGKTLFAWRNAIEKPLGQADDYRG